MRNLDKKVVIVTGGARGMGAAHVRRLVEEGAKVVIADIIDDEGMALAAELGENTSFKRLDVTSEESWEAVVEHTEKTFGTVTSLVNNAGVDHDGVPLHKITLKDFERTVNVNYKGVFLGMKAVLPAMMNVGSGSIVNIGSASGIIGFDNISVYAGTKSALNGLSKSAAIEYGKYGIRVNALHPGIVETPMMRMSLDSNENIKNTVEESLKSQAIPRLGKLSELSGSIAFLLSDDAGFITGTEFLVEGGLVLGSATPVK